MKPDSQLDDFMQQLKSDRVIKIFVGEQTEPYLIPESTVVNASEYFAAHIKYSDGHSFANSEPGVLRFPNDGEYSQAWKIVLFWLANKLLPGEDHDFVGWQLSTVRFTDLVRTWMLADRCLLPKLQDSVMAELLQESYYGFVLIADRDELSAMLRDSPTDSPLRRLLEEETVQHYGEHNSPDNPTLADFLSRYMKLPSSLCTSVVKASRARGLYGFLRQNDSLDMEVMKCWKEYFELETWPNKQYIARHIINSRLDPDGPEWDE